MNPHKLYFVGKRRIELPEYVNFERIYEIFMILIDSLNPDHFSTQSKPQVRIPCCPADSNKDEVYSSVPTDTAFHSFKLKQSWYRVKTRSTHSAPMFLPRDRLDSLHSGFTGFFHMRITYLS